MEATAPKILTVNETAEFLGVSVSTIYKEAQKGRLGRKIGTKWVFTEERLLAYLNGENYHIGR